jgi:hypothetical protein
MPMILCRVIFPLVSALQFSVDSNNVCFSSDRFGPMKVEVQPRRKLTIRRRTPRQLKNDRPEQVCLSSGCSHEQSDVFCLLIGA